MCFNYFSGVDHGTSDQGASLLTSNRLSSATNSQLVFDPSTGKLLDRVVTQDGYFQTGNAIYRVAVFKLNFRWERVIFLIKNTHIIVKAHRLTFYLVQLEETLRYNLLLL